MSIDGVPLHPVIVHVAVVLIPLASIGMIVSVISASWSRRYASVSVTLASVAFVCAVVARQSGEELLVSRSALPEHVSSGNVMPWYALAFFVLSLVFWLFDRGVPLNRPRPLWLKLLAFLVVVSAVAATFQAVVTGHSGALSVWG